MIVRPEQVGDLDAIGVVTQAAFRDVPYSDHNEHLVIERLRRAGALAVSLVAEEDGGDHRPYRLFTCRTFWKQ
jgi:putative acetyltransferase